VALFETLPHWYRFKFFKTLPTGNVAQSQNVTNFNNVAFSETLLFGNVALLKHY
jgi:hypothetical protein